MGATRDVIDHQLGCFGERDLNGVLSDYAWDAVLFTADGPLTGVDERITFERHDCDICIGSDVDDAAEFAIALGPAGEIIRLAGEEGWRRKLQVIATLKETLAPCATRRYMGAVEHLVLCRDPAVQTLDPQHLHRAAP